MLLGVIVQVAPVVSAREEPHGCSMPLRHLPLRSRMQTGGFVGGSPAAAAGGGAAAAAPGAAAAAASSSAVKLPVQFTRRLQQEMKNGLKQEKDAS